MESRFTPPKRTPGRCDIILTLQVLFHTSKLWEVWNFKVTNDKGFVTREKVNMKLKGAVSRHSVKLGNYKMPF